jgi:DnaJ-class molecular chaperone
MDRPAAVRVLPGDLASNAEYASAFVEKARAAAKCSHTNLLQIYETGLAGGRYFCATEFAEGPTFLRVLAESGTLDELAAVEHMSRIAGALLQAHRSGLVHGDVKPGNVFVTESGEPKLADLGLARPPKGPGNPTGSISPHYEAPEVARGGPIDARADLYALGATFFHMVAGRPLFQGDDPAQIVSRHASEPPMPIRQIVPGVSEAFEGVLLTLLAKDPKARYASAEELIDSLRAVSTGGSAQGRSVDPGIVSRSPSVEPLVMADQDSMSSAFGAAEVAPPLTGPAIESRPPAPQKTGRPVIPVVPVPEVQPDEEIEVRLADPEPTAPAPGSRPPAAQKTGRPVIPIVPVPEVQPDEEIEVRLADPEPVAPAPLASPRPAVGRLDVPPDILATAGRPPAEWGRWVRPVVYVLVLAAAGAVLMWRLRRPSEELARARRVKQEVVQLTKARQNREALEAASGLAAMSTKTPKEAEADELAELVAWGEARAEAITTKVGLADARALRARLDAPETAGKAALEEVGKAADDLAQEYDRSKKVVAEAKKLRGEVAARLKRLKQLAAKAKEEKRKKTKTRETVDLLAKDIAEAETLLQEGHFAAAMQIVGKALTKARGLSRRATTAKLEDLSRRIREAALVHWRREDTKARALISREKLGEAKRIYRQAVDFYGVDEITKRAQEALASTEEAERRASKVADAARADGKRAKRAAAEAERLRQEFACAKAAAALEAALAQIKDRETRAELEVGCEVARSELAVMSAIIKMVNTRPVDLSRLKSGARGKMYKADEGGYRTRVPIRGVGETRQEKTWGDLPVDQLCKLAKMAVGRESDAAVSLALFCATHGAGSEKDKAVARVVSAKDEKTLELLARYYAFLGEADTAGKTAGKEPAVARAADRAKQVAVNDQPKTIEVHCPVCSGDCVIDEIGCPRCSRLGFMGIERCAHCAGKGVIDYNCLGCRGHGVVLVKGGEERKCRRCLGKGHPPCPACRGLGKIEKPNPKILGRATRTCANCNGSGFEQKVKCRRCGGKGKVQVSSDRGDVIYFMDVTCPLCRGGGVGPPVCRRCAGKGCSGSNKAPKLCLGCYGTGHSFTRCSTCGGRGWFPIGR